MINAEQIFRSEEAREVTKEVYDGLGEAAANIANKLHLAGKFQVEVSLELRSDDFNDDDCTFRVTVNNVGY